jgi:hypothetical protein
MFDITLFQKVWERLKEDRSQFKLNDVFEDAPNEKGLTIDLIDDVKLTIWENGTIQISDFSA